MKFADDRVRMVRQHMGMGQSEFAKALGVTRNYVSYVETGKRNLSEVALNWVGTLSGANIAWLRDWERETVGRPAGRIDL